MKKLLLFILLFSVGGLALLAKPTNSKIDSILTHVEDYTSCVSKLRDQPAQDLTDYLKTNTDDFEKCKLYNALCWIYFNSDPPKAMEYAKLQYPLAEKSGFHEAIIMSYDNMAYLYQGFSNNEKAVTFMLKGLKAKEAINDIPEISMSLSGLAGTYYKMKNYKLALNYFNQSLEIEKKTGNHTTVGIKREAAIIGNIGLCYVGLSEVDKGLENYLMAVKLYRDAGVEQEASAAYGNIGLIYLNHKKDYNQALIYFKKAAHLHEMENDVSALAAVYGGICEAYSLQNDFSNALIYGKKAVKNANFSGDKGDILESNRSLALALYNNKNYQLAYEHFKIAFDMKDSIFNESSSQQIAEMQTKYDTEKKEAENSLLLAEKELDKAELDKKSTQQKMLLLSLFLALVIVVYIAYSLNQKKKTNKLLNAQNEEISTKNDIIEEKNKDITDSINYAQRIQNAILPVDDLLQKHYESFIYYQPKDIVSGDFYWIKEVDDKIYFSVVDCTGHGVPGAFMSIIGSNSLNRIIDDFKITETGLILDKLNELVLEAIGNKSCDEIDIRDGMDLSLCCIDKSTNKLEYSGAHNSLYLLRSLRNTIKEVEPILEDDNIGFYEVKADKMAIGGNINNNKYHTHLIQLEKNDAIYLFSDGYADQFGGEKGKKFMYKRFKKMFMDIQAQPMHKQLSYIDNTLIDWKGDLDQLDDICIMGVKIN